MLQIENKNYKDTVFRLLFNNKIHLLELYNAINGSNYNDPDALTIKTLSGETFLNMKNDVSFLLDFELNLYEHQSTICPNIPLRELYYLASTLMKEIPREKTYLKTRIEIPVPRFVVFYNGTSDLADKVTYNLSDLFVKKVSDPSIELKVTVYNVNAGHNKALMETCKTLNSYSIFVAKVRKYKKEELVNYNNTHSPSFEMLVDKADADKTIITNAVNRAIDECIEEDHLSDFFSEYRKEVIAVSILEYSSERQWQVIEDDAYTRGYGGGYSTGHNEGIQDTAELFSWLDDTNRQADITKAIHDKDYLSTLFAEYSTWKKDNNIQ